MIQGKILSYEDDLLEVYNIRKKVFVEEHGISMENEFDSLDKEAMHVIVFETDANGKVKQSIEEKRKAVATGRITYDGECCLIDKIAVLKEYRGMKYGDFTVRMLLNKAFTSGIEEVTVHTYSSIEGFFGKIGFYQIGDTYLKCGVSYTKMCIHPQNVNTLCCKN